jgi:hypothetical protein
MKYAMDSWARQVKNTKEIPESFESFFAAIHDNSEQFPYTLFAPPEKWYYKKSTPKLLVLLDDRIYVAEKLKKQIQVTCFLFQDINYIETGTLLLHSWIGINGNVDGKPATTIIEFNTVVEILFKLIIEKIRSTINHLDQSDFAKGQLKKEQSKFDYLVKTNFKYMNFGKRSILVGEQVQQIILQPDIRVKFLKYFQRTLSFTHLTILTDNELILVKDDDSFKTAQHVRYGGIWCYIPLPKIKKMTVESILENDLAKLTFQLPDNVNICSLFSITQKSELNLLIDGINKSKIVTQQKCV